MSRRKGGPRPKLRKTINLGAKNLNNRKRILRQERAMTELLKELSGLFAKIEEGFAEQGAAIGLVYKLAKGEELTIEERAALAEAFPEVEGEPEESAQLELPLEEPKPEGE